MNTNVFKFVGAAIVRKYLKNLIENVAYSIFLSMRCVKDIDAADVLEPGTPYASGGMKIHKSLESFNLNSANLSDHVSRDRKSVHDLALDFNFPGIHMASSRFKIPEHSYGGGDVSENESEYSSNAGESPAENGSTAMGEKLKLAFELNNAESFKGEYACWLIKSVLLKGFMYLTDNHILFYAALPEQQLMIRRQGFLGKRSNPSKQYTNLYFLLKGSVLSYYDNSTVGCPSGLAMTITTNATLGLVLSSRGHRFKNDRLYISLKKAQERFQDCHDSQKVLLASGH